MLLIQLPDCLITCWELSFGANNLTVLGVIEKARDSLGPSKNRPPDEIPKVYAR